MTTHRFGEFAKFKPARLEVAGFGECPPKDETSDNTNDADCNQRNPPIEHIGNRSSDDTPAKSTDCVAADIDSQRHSQAGWINFFTKISHRNRWESGKHDSLQHP